jgi:hypothetical protein
MTIRHPFTFVPFPATLPREKWPGNRPSGHESYQPNTLSGTFECTLTTITPLCIKEHFSQLHGKPAPPFIPGSSLKGMLRNTLQILGFGCAGQQFQNKTARQQEKDKKIPPLELGHMKPCDEGEACMVCRVFGYGVKKEGRHDDDEAEPFGWAAKVRIFDSEPAQDWNENRWVWMNDGACSVGGHIPAMPQDQGPRHKAFYYPFGDGRPAGWKVYRHATRVTKIDDGYASGDCVKSGTRFPFRVEFESLSAAEFAAFQFALSLTHECPTHGDLASGRLLHKMGYGKGVGMGSCRVEITRRESLAVRRFFQEPASAPAGEPCGLATLLDSQIFKGFRDARSTSGAADLLVFPTWQEFKDSPGKSIDDYDQFLARQRPEVRFPQPPPPPHPPRQPDPISLPKVVTGLITSIKNNVVRGETVEEYNGSKYRFEVPSHAGFGNPVRGSEVKIAVDARGVNHDVHTFRGTRWQA